MQCTCDLEGLYMESCRVFSVKSEFEDAQTLDSRMKVIFLWGGRGEGERKVLHRFIIVALFHFFTSVKFQSGCANSEHLFYMCVCVGGGGGGGRRGGEKSRFVSLLNSQCCSFSCVSKKTLTMYIIMRHASPCKVYCVKP